MIASALLVGCGSTPNTTSHTNGAFDINALPTSTLTQDLKDAIAYMGNEERLAYDIYTNLYDYHLENNHVEIRQLYNIAHNSEIKHVGIVQDIVKKYNLGEDNLTNNDLNQYIVLTQDANATDVEEAFNILREGSYNHYWAFDRGLKNLGIANGCYVEGDALLGENKEGIYPQR